MPRTCLACSNPNRAAIDKALATGEPLREISGKSRISISALHRHKAHAGQAIVRAAGKREEALGESILRRLEALYGRTEKILDAAETSGDHRLALQAVRETRENLAGIFALANKAAEVSRSKGGPMSIADRLTEARERIARDFESMTREHLLRYAETGELPEGVTGEENGFGQ